MKKTLLIFLFSSLLLVLSACGNSTQGASTASGEEPIKLTYAFFSNQNTFLGHMVEYWSEQVEERTNGKVEINVQWDGTLLDSANMYDGIRNKVADIGISIPQYEPGRYPLVEIGEIMTGYPNGTVASQVAGDLIKEYPPENLSDLKIINGLSNDINRVFTNEKIETIDDLKGMQLRVGAGFTDLVSEFGAVGVGLTQPQMAEALQTGVVDGTITERALLKDAQYAELVDYLIEQPLYVVSYAAVMRQETWDSLPADVQKVIEELQDELAVYAGEYLGKHTEEVIEWSIEEHGLEVITLSDEEKKKWNIIIDNYREKRIQELEAQGLPAKEYEQRALELIEKYSNE